MTPTRHRHGGLWSKVKDASGAVDHAAWLAALEGNQHVGNCPEVGCGQPLRPGEPDSGDRRGVVWYPAECTACGHVINGRSPRPTGGG